MAEPFYIVGPCAAETRAQVLETARLLAKEAGIHVFRAPAWKPRTQPGHFEGVGEDALAWLQEVRLTYGMKVATEVATAEHVRLAAHYHIDYLWIGARTTANPFLVQQLSDALREASQVEGYIPHVLIKNPISPDVALWQGAIERMAAVVGMESVMAVHRGFSSTSTPYRNAPMWPVAFELRQRLPGVPLLLDASHMAGSCDGVEVLSRQAMSLGYDGLMLESHCAPEEALSDAQQQLTPSAVGQLLRSLCTRASSCDMGLQALRSEMDELDDTLWSLILQRMQVSRRIGQYKQAHHLPVLQQSRYEAVLQKRLEWARQNGLDEQAVLQLMTTLHAESCRWQL